METIDQMTARHAAEIAAENVPTESEMRDAKVPTPDTTEELAEYVRALVDRPHDYGTCVYAMSMAAVAAYNFVARKLGVTGFQASCADMDILGRTRGWKWGKILDYEHLLYPQYLNEENFPSASDLLYEHAAVLAEKAQAKLAESPDAHPAVLAHWKRLIATGTRVTPPSPETEEG